MVQTRASSAAALLGTPAFQPLEQKTSCVQSKPSKSAQLGENAVENTENKQYKETLMHRLVQNTLRERNERLRFKNKHAVLPEHRLAPTAVVSYRCEYDLLPRVCEDMFPKTRKDLVLLPENTVNLLLYAYEKQPKGCRQNKINQLAEMSF